MVFRVIGDVAMVVHFLFLAYVVIGGFIAWYWPRSIWLHLGCALYGLAVTVVGWVCPLTVVENWARQRAGQAGLTETGFIDHYLTGIIYPVDHLVSIQFAAGVVVALSWVGYLFLLWRRRAAARTPAPGG